MSVLSVDWVHCSDFHWSGSGMRFSSKRVFLLRNKSQVLIPVFKSVIRMIITARHIKMNGLFYTKRSEESITRMLVLLPCICGHAKEDLRSVRRPSYLEDNVCSYNGNYFTLGTLTFCHIPFKEHVFSREFQPWTGIWTVFRHAPQHLSECLPLLLNLPSDSSFITMTAIYYKHIQVSMLSCEGKNSCVWYKITANLDILFVVFPLGAMSFI